MAKIKIREFGQEHPLLTALHKLVRDYPLSVGLFKEFIQNADDAGASEIRFIIDSGDYPSKALPDPGLACLSGPALLVWNDAMFNEEDIVNIQNVGDSRKLESPSKTGRFGLGFNCCYNVTDYPTLITGRALYLFDPHKTALAHSGNGRPGGSFDLVELWEGAADLLSPFRAAGLDAGTAEFPATIFRLPLRNEAHNRVNGRIKTDLCTPAVLEALVKEFERFAPSILIFLKRIRTIVFEKISRAGSDPQELMCVETQNTDEVVLGRGPLLAAVNGSIDAVLTRLEATAAQPPRTVFTHDVSVSTEAGSFTHRWLVSSGLEPGLDCSLLKLARQLWSNKEKVIPWVGVAAKLGGSDLDEPVAVEGEISCFLPLPDARGGCHLPVHINGFFDIDSNRRSLTYESSAQGTIESLRRQWNRMLIVNGVAVHYVRLLGKIIEALPECSPKLFYALWLDVAQPFPAPLSSLAQPLYLTLAQSPLLKSAAGKWLASRQLRQASPELCEALLADACETIAIPEIPAHVLHGLELAKQPIEALQPKELREIFRLTADVACSLDSAPRPSLQRRTWLEALLRFAQIGASPAALKGLPFLLLSDGCLHTLGYVGRDAFIAGDLERRVFRSHSEWFVDASFVVNTGLREMPDLGIQRMSADVLVDNLKRISPKEESADSRGWDPKGKLPPNESWLVEVFEYLLQQEDGWKPDQPAMELACLVPDQFGRLSPCGLPATPLLIPNGFDEKLRTAVEAFRLPLVTCGKKLLEAIRVMHERFGWYVWPITPVDLVDTLAAKKGDWRDQMRSWRVQIHQPLLQFLSGSEALMAFRDPPEQSADRLERLRGLPIFPTRTGEIVSISENKCFVAANVTAPGVVLDTKILRNGPWAELLTLLGVQHLSVKALLEQILIPAFGDLSQDDQFTTLSWIRDHLDQALTEAGEGQEHLIDSLQAAKLIRGSDSHLHAGNTLYVPGNDVVKQVMGDYAVLPNMQLYSKEQSRWLPFFERLGIAKSPRASDLAGHILDLMDRCEKDGSTADVMEPLTVVLNHIVEHWEVLRDSEVEDRDGHSISFGDFLRDHEWCPPLRGSNNLRHLLIAPDPEDRLFPLSELYPPVLGHLVGSVNPLMPLENRERIPHAIRDLVPEVVRVPTDVVVAHFENLIELFSTGGVPEEKAIRTPLTRIYTYLGEKLRQVSRDTSEDDNGGAVDEDVPGLLDEEAVKELRERFANQPCIYVPELKQFRTPTSVFRKSVAYAAPWFVSCRYADPKVEAGLELLGRKEEPSLEDLCALTGTIRQSNGGPLADELALNFLRVLQRIDELASAAELPQLFLLEERGQITEPTRLLYPDADWLEERMNRAAVQLVDPRVPFGLALRAGVRRLSEEVLSRPKGMWAVSQEPGFVELCQNAEMLVRTNELNVGLRRILAKAGHIARRQDVAWLETISIHPKQRIGCIYFVLEQEAEIIVAEADEETYFAEDDNTLFIAEGAASVFYEKLAEAIRRRLKMLPLGDLSQLTRVLRCKPKEIDDVLTLLRVQRLREHAGSEISGSVGEVAISGFLGGPDDENEVAGTSSAGIGQPNSPESGEDDNASLEIAGDLESLGAGFSGDEIGSSDSVPEQADDESAPDSAEEDQETRDPATAGDSYSGGKDGAPKQGTARTGSAAGHRRTQQIVPRPRRSTGLPEVGHSRSAGATASRDRLMSYVLDADQTTEHATRGDSSNDELAPNHKIGNTAVQWVLQYERQQGRKPQNQVHNNRGFDVLSKEGRLDERYIEVKGMAGEWSADGVPLSTPQFELAWEERDKFWLYVVEYALDPAKVRIHAIQNPAGKITQFRFDQGWRALALKEKPFTPLVTAPGVRILVPDDDGFLREGVIRALSTTTSNGLAVRFGDRPPDQLVWYDPMMMILLPPPEEVD